MPAAVDDVQPQEGDIVLESFSVHGFVDGERVGIHEEIRYCHSDRSLIRFGYCTNGVTSREVLLTSIPEDIRTKEELRAYAEEHDIIFLGR